MLAEQADVVAHVAGVDLAQVHAVEQHVALLRLEQAGRQAQHGGFAAADTTQHADALASLDVEAHVLADLRALFTIVEGRLVEGDLALDVGGADVAAVDVAFGLALDDAVQALQRGARLLVADHQAGDLAQRCEDTAGQDHARDQRTHGDAAGRLGLVDQVGTVQHQEHGVGLLHQLREVDDQVADVLLAHGGGSGGGSEALPALLRPVGGVVGLEGFDALDGLDSQALALRALAHGNVDGLGQRLLRQQAGNHHDGHGEQRHDGQGAGHHVHDENEQQHEGQIDQGQQAGAGHEIAHRFEIAQIVGVGAGGDRLLREVDRHDAAEQGRADDQVGLLAGDVGETRADVAGSELEQVGEQHADTEHPQGFVGLVGDDAVVHVHHVE